MASSAYIGLALTAHNTTATCEAVFSNVTITGNAGTLWTNQDVGIQSNDAEPFYVAVSNTAGNPAVIVHDNTDAALIDTWTEWVIPCKPWQSRVSSLPTSTGLQLAWEQKVTRQRRVVQVRCLLTTSGCTG